jgi:hypothetical protein
MSWHAKRLSVHLAMRANELSIHAKGNAGLIIAKEGMRREFVSYNGRKFSDKHFITALVATRNLEDLSAYKIF